MSKNTLEQPYTVSRLDKTTSQENIDRLVQLANLIPHVQYASVDLLADEKPDGRILHDKWHHSYALRVNDHIEGFIMGYMRNAGRNDLYPITSLYISELAVDPIFRKRQYAQKLIGVLLSNAVVDGVQDFTLQTNAADWNKPVHLLYEKFGFSIDGIKEYDNRTDVIMRAHSRETK